MGRKGENYIMKCLMCHPKLTTISAFKNSTSNLRKPVETLRPCAMPEGSRGSFHEAPMDEVADSEVNRQSSRQADTLERTVRATGGYLFTNNEGILKDWIKEEGHILW
ncbi:unnamed protein product [Arctogadus glacialis]